MQEKVEIITNHVVHIWTILDKNTQKRILCKRWRENIYSRAFVNEKNINQYIADNYGQFGTFCKFFAQSK